jgi:hypothetical protein
VRSEQYRGWSSSLLIVFLFHFRGFWFIKDRIDVAVVVQPEFEITFIFFGRWILKLWNGMALRGNNVCNRGDFG